MRYPRAEYPGQGVFSLSNLHERIEKSVTSYDRENETSQICLPKFQNHSLIFQILIEKTNNEPRFRVIRNRPSALFRIGLA